ncbi:unnamed protein product [Heterobilharzia americana]|nr:unnamed protein product [Heterobilharzia americana]
MISSQHLEEQLLPDTELVSSDCENSYVIKGKYDNSITTKKFLLKICIIVCTEILITVLITTIFSNVTAIKKALNEHPWISPAFGKVNLVQRIDKQETSNSNHAFLLQKIEI